MTTESANTKPWNRGRKPRHSLESEKLNRFSEARLIRHGNVFVVELWGIKSEKCEERLFESVVEAESRAYLRGLITGSILRTS